MIFHNILYFSWSEIYFWKHLFLFRGFLIMKTTFSYFPGMFENPEPTVKTSWKLNITYLKNQKYHEIITIYESVKKLLLIICCNIYMIYLEFNWFFIRSLSNLATFRIFYKYANIHSTRHPKLMCFKNSQRACNRNFSVKIYNAILEAFTWLLK